MDQNQVIEAFQMILSGEKQKMDDGQAFIQNCHNSAKFGSHLMVIIDKLDLDINLRQFAITQLKLIVEKRWKPVGNDQKQNLNELPSEDKTEIRNNIIEAMIRVSNNSKLYKTYEKIIYSIAAVDFPTNWNQVINQINEKLSSSDDFNILFGCLCALKCIVQVFEFQLGEEERAPLEEIVNITFPTLIKLVGNIYNNYNEQTAVLLQQILKIFYISVNLEIPKYMADFTIIDSWLSVFQQFFKCPVPEQYRVKPNSEHELRILNKIIFWRNKKSIAKILMRFVQKYSNDKLEGKNSNGLSKHFLNNYGTNLIDMFLGTLNNSNQEFISLPTIHFSMRYIQMSLRVKILTQYLQPYLSNLAIQVCVPLLALTQTDQHLFNNDPIEYMRKEEDFTQTMYNPKNAAMDLIQSVVKVKEGNHLQNLLEFFYQVMLKDSTNEQALTLNQKDGILWAIGELYPDILANEQMKGSIEIFLEKFALPLFQSEQAFIRSRIGWLYGVYGTLEFKNQNTVREVTRLMCSSILDKNLVTKTQACIALNKFLKQDLSKNIIRAEVRNLVGIYLKLMEEVDSEYLVHALEGIIENFSEEVKDFSINLVLQLLEAFQRYDEKEEQDDDMYGEGEFAAAGCLNAINKILASNLSPQVYVELERSLLPTITYSLCDDSEYIEEGLDMLAILIKKTPKISESLYFLFISLHYFVTGIKDGQAIYKVTGITEDQVKLLQNMKDGNGSEFTSKLLPIYKNIIQKDPAAFLVHKDFFGVSFVDLMFTTVQACVEIGESMEEETDMCNMLDYFIAFIENYLNQKNIDQIVMKILETVLSYLHKYSQQKDYKQFIRKCYLTICTCLIYSPLQILQKFEQLSVTQTFFEHMFTSLLSQKKLSQHNDLELQKYILGISNILPLLTSEQVPASIQNILPRLMETTVFLTTLSLEIREYDDDEDEENEDDDDGFGGGFFDKVEYSDKYDCPLDTIDELIDLEEKLIAIKGQNEAVYNQLLGFLDEKTLNKLKENLVEGRKQYNEYLQNQNQN